MTHCENIWFHDDCAPPVCSSQDTFKPNPIKGAFSCRQRGVWLFTVLERTTSLKKRKKNKKHRLLYIYTFSFPNHPARFYVWKHLPKSSLFLHSSKYTAKGGAYFMYTPMLTFELRVDDHLPPPSTFFLRRFFWASSLPSLAEQICQVCVSSCTCILPSQ